MTICIYKCAKQAHHNMDMDINKYNNSENVFHFMGKYYGRISRQINMFVCKRRRRRERKEEEENEKRKK